MTLQLQNQIILGDCLEKMKDIPDNSVDMILTDPPYFLPAKHSIGSREKGYKRTLSDTSVLTGYFKLIFDEFNRVIKDNGTFYIFCDGQSYPVFYNLIYPYCKYVRPLIWDKIVSYNGFTWRHQHELILWGQLDNTENINTGDGDVLKCRGVLQKDRLHPAEKPIELIEKLINKHDYKIIFDPYAGSGTTAIACLNTKRNYICIELDENYFDVMKERIEKHTIQEVLM